MLPAKAKHAQQLRRPKYEESVFLNVPFNAYYTPIFNALIFGVFDCGFVARSARELDDGASVRIDKIYSIIASSKYGIHDISNTALDRVNKLPQFNMPLELGIFLGAKFFGLKAQKNKCGLILDQEKYRYQKFCSDIAGQDIKAHNNKPDEAIRCVRHWLNARADSRGKLLPSAKTMCHRYRIFLKQLPRLCKEVHLDCSDLGFNDYTALVSGWLQANKLA